MGFREKIYIYFALEKEEKRNRTLSNFKII